MMALIAIRVASGGADLISWARAVSPPEEGEIMGRGLGYFISFMRMVVLF